MYGVLPLGPLPSSASDAAQLIHSFAALGILLTAVIALARFWGDQRRRAEQRQAELRKREESTRASLRELQWKRSVQAQLILDKMESDRLSADAMLMLDWDGRPFPTTSPKFIITKTEVLAALRTTNLHFNDKEVYVRDCFDRLFWFFERINHQIRMEMISTSQVNFPLKYVIGLMLNDEKVFTDYFKAYHCVGAAALMKSFKKRGVRPISAPYGSVKMQQSNERPERRLA